MLSNGDLAQSLGCNPRVLVYILQPTGLPAEESGEQGLASSYRALLTI